MQKRHSGPSDHISHDAVYLGSSFLGLVLAEHISAFASSLVTCRGRGALLHLLLRLALPLTPVTLSSLRTLTCLQALFPALWQPPPPMGNRTGITHGICLYPLHGNHTYCQVCDYFFILPTLLFVNVQAHFPFLVSFFFCSCLAHHFTITSQRTF